MKHLSLLGALLYLALSPLNVFAADAVPASDPASAAAADAAEDQYDKDYEACSQMAEEKADPLPEDKREDAFVKYFHECMKKKGHDVSSEEEDLPPSDEVQDVGQGVEE
jgi:hypothetical protein